MSSVNTSFMDAAVAVHESLKCFLPKLFRSYLKKMPFRMIFRANAKRVRVLSLVILPWPNLLPPEYDLYVNLQQLKINVSRANCLPFKA
ncbi:MAG: hypothetical protein K0R96_19 [Pantoea agglomerans]|nr:hypothetical protein [Pantoea agglomerans]